MTCVVRQRALLVDALRASERELEAHAANCDECQHVIDEIRAARNAAKQHAPEPAAAARARVWHNLEHESARSTWQRFAPALALAAAAAVFLAVLGSVERSSLDRAAPRVVTGAVSLTEGNGTVGAGREAPRDTWLTAESNVELGLPSARLFTNRGAIVNVVAATPRTTEIRFFSGQLRATVEKLSTDESFEIVTRQARIRVVGTQFVVRTSAHATEVSVEEGTVWVWASEQIDGAPRVLHRGERTVITLEKPPAPSAPRPVPAAAIEEPVALAPPAKRTPSENAAAPQPMPATASPSDEARVSPATSAAHERLSAAEATLERDALAAARMAETVLEERPPQNIEAHALAVLADAYRREGRSEEAAEIYRRVVGHPAGSAYAEEAVYQRALLLVAMGQGLRARAELMASKARFASGALAPERAALVAEIDLGSGNVTSAIVALEEAAAAARARGDHPTADMYVRRKLALEINERRRRAPETH